MNFKRKIHTCNYPDDEDGQLKHLCSTLHLRTFENAAVVIQRCSDRPRLREHVLIRLNYFIRDVTLVFHKTLN